MKNIETKEDIVILVKKFYDKLLTDELVKEKFAGLNLEAHLPHVADFWASVAFPEYGYGRNLIDKHAHLTLEEKHFKRWKELFYETLDELYAGDKVELIKQRTESLEGIMKYKLGVKDKS